MCVCVCGWVSRFTLSGFSGAPFTHQRTPEHMIYYGQSSCESNLDRYLESLKSLWRRRPQSRETPVIINTMGWVKGQQGTSMRSCEHTGFNGVYRAVSRLPQDLGSSCSWTWSASSRCLTSSSSVTGVRPSAPPSVRSSWGRHTASRRTPRPRPPWRSSQRATAPPEATLTSLYNQSFKGWRVKGQREFTSSACGSIGKLWSSCVVVCCLLCVCLLYTTGNTSAAMSTESCPCWPTWVSCSLLTLDQFDLYTASPPYQVHDQRSKMRQHPRLGTVHHVHVLFIHFLSFLSSCLPRCDLSAAVTSQ